MRKYYGTYADENGKLVFNDNGTGLKTGLKTGYFMTVGEMCDGSKVYEMVDGSSDTQYLRTTRQGMTVFYPL